MPLSRFLGGANSPPPSTATNNPEDTTKASVNSDLIVILTALLCAVIFVLGLVAVARCAWARLRLSAASRLTPPSANKGLKKKVLKSLPKQTFPNPNGEEGGNLTECAICLTEFVEGDEIRLLPQCGHGFHVACIDTWLRTHSSCPSCRRVVLRCHNCGEWPPDSARPHTSALPSFLP